MLAASVVIKRRAWFVRLLLLAFLVYEEQDSGGMVVSGFSSRRPPAQKHATISLHNAAVSLESSDPSRRAGPPPARMDGTAAGGLYRPFADCVWQRLQDRCCGNGGDPPLLQTVDIPSDLAFHTAPAPGPPRPPISAASDDGTTTMKKAVAAARVDMSVRALQQPTSSSSSSSPIRYARLALLETMTEETNSDDSAAVNNTGGIQVLNLVIFPAAHLDFPVWGADFVTLPGNKHLLLLDAQPMGDAAATDWSRGWKDWYEKYRVAETYPWGGDLPEKVQPYVSKYALWTRLGSAAADAHDDSSAVRKDPMEQIQGLMAAFEEHLDIYLDLLLEQQDVRSEVSPKENRQRDYIQYRLDNDPARPMLKRLYGEEWTEKVLHDVLFPQP